MLKKAFLFLNGHYYKEDRSMVLSLYRRAKPKPLLVAVDGGLAFIQRIGLRPKYWLTDLDSAPDIKKGFLKNTELLLHQSHKDKTDAELALDFCTRQRISDFTFFGWYDRNDETDHLLGNLMLAHLLKGIRKNIRLRFLGSRQEIHYLHNETKILNSSKERRLSVIPLDRSISLSMRGTEYKAAGLNVREGRTIGLRNRITAGRAVVTVKGSALVIIAR
jgi:thiamine pyrophosphokinase